MKNVFLLIYDRIKTVVLKVFSYPYSIAICILCFFLILFIFSTKTNLGFLPVATRLVSNMESSDSIRDVMVYKNANLNPCTRALANQYSYINNYKKQHLAIAQNFNLYYYAFALIVVIATVASTLLGILIARTGWQNQSSSVKSAFVAFFFTASLTGVLMSTFNNAENANKNISKYFYFTNLQTNIYDAMAVDTALDSACTNGTLMNIFLENNKNIKENMNLFLDIKADKIPSTPDMSSIGN